MNFYSVLFIHLKVLVKSKLHILSALILRSKSFNTNQFHKFIEVNKNEKIRGYLIDKDMTVNWFIQKFSVKKVSSKLNLSNWVKLLKITQLKRKIFFNESSKIKSKTKNKTLPKKKK